MSQFKVNDIAVTQHAVYPQNNGQEVVIIGALQKRKARRKEDQLNIFEVFSYLVRFSDGETGIAEPHQLRRKSPPASTADEREYEALMDRLMNRKEQTA